MRPAPSRPHHGSPPRRPNIGITPDYHDHAGQAPIYELKAPYADAVLRAGGLPLIFPYTDEPTCVDQYLDRIAGLLVTGGAFAIPRSLHGEAQQSRPLFETALLQGALRRNLPVLGICSGMQLLNVVLGGTLLQDIRREVDSPQEHEQPHDCSQPFHPVEVKEGTLLAEAVGTGQVMVNSTHRQAVKRTGEKVVVSAVAPDGVVEAIEAPAQSFAVGIQWHPEMLINTMPLHLSIYRAFVHKARESRR